MKYLTQNKRFILGFTAGLIIFGYINYDSYVNNQCGYIVDLGGTIGFPFPFYQEAGFIGFTGIVWVGLIADILITLFASSLLGLVFKLYSLKFHFILKLLNLVL